MFRLPQFDAPFVKVELRLNQTAAETENLAARAAFGKDAVV
jgi:hypothetical protein